MTFENGIFFNCLSYERRVFYAILKMRVDSYKLFRISCILAETIRHSENGNRRV